MVKFRLDQVIHVFESTYSIVIIVIGSNLQAVTDEEMLLALTTQLSGQVSEGANTNTIEYNSLTFEYKVMNGVQ